MKHLLYLSPKRAVILMALIFTTSFVIWLVRRQRRLVHADLQNRGLVPSKRRHRSRRSPEKHNPTLAEIGIGLPPVRNTPPPGPTDG